MKNLQPKLYTYKNIEKDKEGYLKKTKEWNTTIAKEIAKKEQITLTYHHWIIINFVRTFYLQFNMTPSTRMLINGIKNIIGKKSNSIYLFKLFPKGPAKQASKIAGIPKPIQCL